MFKEFPILHTERLRLRSLELSDAEEFMEIAPIPSQGKFTIEQTKEKITNVNNGYKDGEMITWAIEYNGQFAGTTGYYRGFKDQTGEIGYVLKKQYRNMGFMTEACKEVIQFGINILGLKLITAYTKDGNQYSIALLHKLGFEKTEEFGTDNYRRYERPISLG